MGIGKEIPIGKARQDDDEVVGHSAKGSATPDEGEEPEVETAGHAWSYKATDEAKAAANGPEVAGHHVGSADAPASERGDRDRRRDG